MKKVFFFIFSFLLLSSAHLAAESQKNLPTLALLQQMIRINTTNPPGNEIQLAQWIQAYLSQFQIPSEIIESAPGRASLIARLKGSGKKGTLALLGHLDVVPADPKEWDFLPFGAQIENGYLYGRGVLDMKGLVALEIAAFVKLKLEEFPLEGDVVLVLVADEEAGGTQGAKYLVEHHWDKIKAQYVFNEGSIANERGGRHFYPIQVAEKGVAWMKLSALGKSGHGSMPTQDNAVQRLIRAIHLLTQHPQPITPTPVVEQFTQGLAATESFPESFIMKHFFNWPIQKFFKSFIEEKLQKEKAFNAMLRNTITPTMLEAGYKVNVIPNLATGVIDVRVLPGSSPQKFRKVLEEKINDPHVKIELLQESLPNESPFQTDYFKTFERVILKNDPLAVILPYMSPGATDSRFFRAKGALAYGIIPFVIDTPDIESIHGKNERVKISEIERGEKILYDLLQSLQGKNSPP